MIGLFILIIVSGVLLLVVYCTFRLLLTLHRNEFTDIER
jgi:hypothetical protein